MEKLFRISILIFAVIILSCSDRDPTNPYDPEVGTEFPPVTLNSVTVVDIAKLQIAWTSNYEYYTIFKLERSTIDQILGFSKIAEIPQGTFSYADTLVNADTTYYYRVKGMVDELPGPYSNVISCSIYITSPGSLNAIVLNDQEVFLTWNDNSTFEEGYEVERSDDGISFEEVVSLEADVTEFRDEGLNFGSSYTYRVRAFASQYYSDYSNETNIQTIFPAPTNLVSILVSDTAIQIEWDDNCQFEEGFTIERRDGGSGFEQIAIVPSNNITFIDTELMYGLEYTYRIRAYTSFNTSDYTNETNLLIEIIAPSNLVATVDSTSITLNWTDNSDIEENFEIERKITGEDFQLIATVNINIETFIDINVEALITYFYRVRAVTLNNQSVYSNIANATITGE